ncbi:MAG: hypothetical protein JNM84_15300 [Planctomycetes bacterium]|nr:hypothetical protein [Planctomycetota bacterium]
MPKAWNGKFPVQARVELVTQAMVELPKGTLGSAKRIVEGARVAEILELVRSLSPIRES